MAQIRRALFPGSFDPFTHGHREVVECALAVFDEIVVGIGISSSKKALFSVEERLAMIRDVFRGDARVTAVSFVGLAVEHARLIKAQVLIRGLRTEADFAYEMPMALTNKTLAADLITLFVPTSSSFAYVSSTVVKEIAQFGGDISAFVPEPVHRRLTALYGGK